MAQAKPKKLVQRRRLKATNSPEPTTTPGARCGHSNCSDTCRVRYVGAVSRISDHHILHAARGASHIWTAAIVSGLAVVLTGAVAFHSAQAASDRSSTQRTQQVKEDLGQKIDRLNNRIAQMQGALNRMTEQCGLDASEPSADGDQTPPVRQDTPRTGSASDSGAR